MSFDLARIPTPLVLEAGSLGCTPRHNPGGEVGHQTAEEVLLTCFCPPAHSNSSPPSIIHVPIHVRLHNVTASKSGRWHHQPVDPLLYGMYGHCGQSGATPASSFHRCIRSSMLVVGYDPRQPRGSGMALLRSLSATCPSSRCREMATGRSR